MAKQTVTQGLKWPPDVAAHTTNARTIPIPYAKPTWNRAASGRTEELETPVNRRQSRAKTHSLGMPPQPDCPQPWMLSNRHRRTRRKTRPSNDIRRSEFYSRLTVVTFTHEFCHAFYEPVQAGMPPTLPSVHGLRAGDDIAYVDELGLDVVHF